AHQYLPLSRVNTKPQTFKDAARRSAAHGLLDEVGGGFHEWNRARPWSFTGPCTRRGAARPLPRQGNRKRQGATRTENAGRYWRRGSGDGQKSSARSAGWTGGSVRPARTARRA